MRKRYNNLLEIIEFDAKEIIASLWRYPIKRD